MIGIVILNYNKWEITIECVESIKRNCDLEKKIYIIDNCSQNGSYEILKNHFLDDSTIEVIYSEVNGGYAKGNNIGIEACIKDNIKHTVITNNDIIFNKDSIKIIYNTITSLSNAVIVAPKILTIENKATSMPFVKRQNLFQYLGIISNKHLILNDTDANKTLFVYLVSGCCFIIDTKKFKEMGAFDEGTFLYNEEGIVSAQSLACNFNIIYAPEANVIHNHGTTTGRTNLFVDTEMLKSGMYYWKKYEKLSCLNLIFLYFVMICRIILKIILHRYSKQGIGYYCKSTFKTFVKIIKTDYK